MSILTFKPLYQERVWGGHWLAEKFGRRLPEGKPIGESWEVVDRVEAQSIEPASGWTLRELLQQRSEEIMGPGHNPAHPFPILVKWLDCSDRLSLQVHPPAPIAEHLGGEPKTECWYIADATAEAALIVGLKRGVTRAQFKQAIAVENLEPLLHRFPVRTGHSILLESGRLHAIDAGSLILEIQENSDTTYRVYDWGRKGLDGKPRQLHVEESMQSIDFDDFEPAVTPASNESGETALTECRQFRIRQ
ncbi:MAG: type I phosphomannose isomerase catalytic subunit, partial [Xanthomonadales bacterium]|nr:type I phosphomannose isomerase catalytic subunit [Xanthomonadales bacterium]